MLRRYPLGTYFVLAFIFTWLILSPGVAATIGLFDWDHDGTVLTILAGVGPLLAAIVVTYASDGRASVRRIFRSMVDWKIKRRWWAAAVLLSAGLFAVAAMLGMLMGGTAPDPGDGIYLGGGRLLIVSLLLLLGSFGEEPGWRGFALPGLQHYHSPLKASLIVTAV